MADIDISELLNRRNDISTFLVHLCKDVNGFTAQQALKSILSNKPPTIDASPAGLYFEDPDLNTDAVSFTETPLEHIYTFVAPIRNKHNEYRKYGLVFSKEAMRVRGACPIWYINHIQDQGSEVRTALDRLKESLDDEQRTNFGIIAPFLEVWGKYPKRDFYWEREWRFRGNFIFQLSEVILGICPEDELNDWETQFQPIKFIDPVWGVDRIIEKLSRWNR